MVLIFEKQLSRFVEIIDISGTEHPGGSINICGRPHQIWSAPPSAFQQKERFLQLALLPCVPGIVVMFD